MLCRALGVVCTGASLTSLATSSLAEIEGKDDGVSLLQVNALRMSRTSVKDVFAVDLADGEVVSHLPKTEVVQGTDSAKRSVHRHQHGYNGHQGENSASAAKAEFVVKKVEDAHASQHHSSSSSTPPTSTSPLPKTEMVKGTVSAKRSVHRHEYGYNGHQGENSVAASKADLMVKKVEHSQVAKQDSSSSLPKTEMVKGTDSAKRSVHGHEYGYNGHQGETIAAMAKADLLVKVVNDTSKEDSARPLPKTEMVKGTDSAKRSVHHHEYGYNGHQGENNAAMAKADLLVKEVDDTPQKDSALSTPVSDVAQDSSSPLPKTEMVKGTDSAKRSVHRHEYGYNGHQGENSAAMGKADLLVKEVHDTPKQDSARPLPKTEMVMGTDSAKRSVHRHEYGYNGHQGENSAAMAKAELLVKEVDDNPKQVSARPLPKTEMVKGTNSAKRSVHRHEYGYNGHQGESSAALPTADLLVKEVDDTPKQDSALATPVSDVAQDSSSPLPKTEMVKGTDSAKRSVHRHEYGYNGHQGENSAGMAKADLLVKEVDDIPEQDSSSSPPKTEMVRGTDSAKRSVHRHEDGYNGHQGENNKDAAIVSNADAPWSQASLARIQPDTKPLQPTQMLKGTSSAKHTFQRTQAEDVVTPVSKSKSIKHGVDKFAPAAQSVINPGTLLGSSDSQHHVSKLSRSDVTQVVQKKHSGRGGSGGHGSLKPRTHVVARDEDLCDPMRALDFDSATVSHSNLGGQGPDSGDETLVFENIAIKSGEIVNLIVTATTSYAPRDAGKNGLSDGFGVVNLGVNTPVDLLFRFVSRATGAAVAMDPFYFTFFDLDQGRAHKSREKVIVQGLSAFTVSEDSSIDVTDLGSSAIFSSSMRGGKVDNPIAALSLNRLQRERSVVATFRGISEFSVTLSEEEYADGDQGRNWLFAGPSQLVCDGERKCTEYDCPSGYHIRTMAEFLVCADTRCTDDDRDTCCYEAENEDDDEGSNDDEEEDSDDEDQESDEDEEEDGDEDEEEDSDDQDEEEDSDEDEGEDRDDQDEEDDSNEDEEDDDDDDEAEDEETEDVFDILNEGL